MVKRLCKTFLVEGLKQIINGMDLERFQGIGVIRRDKNHHWNVCASGSNGRAHLQAVQAWHLNVQEDEVGFFALDYLDGLTAIGAFSHDGKVRFVFKQLPNPSPRWGLVI